MSAAYHIRGKRSFTGNHSFLPATRTPSPPDLLPNVPSYTFITWTFGGGSIVSKIWPAVLLHTLFAAGVVYVWFASGKTLGIPNMMLTVLAVVIRVRDLLSRLDILRPLLDGPHGVVARYPKYTLTWSHYLVPYTAAEAEVKRVMHEKKMALDLVDGSVFRLINYSTTTRPHYQSRFNKPYSRQQSQAHAGLSPPQRLPSAQLPMHRSALQIPYLSRNRRLSSSHYPIQPPQDLDLPMQHGTPDQRKSLACLARRCLHTPPPRGPEGSAPFRRVAPDIIPFAGLFASLRRAFRSNSTAPDTPADATGEERDHRRTCRGPVHPEKSARRRWKAARERNALNARVARLVYEGNDLDTLAELRRDNQPDDEAGENLPAEILRCLSEWVAVLEERRSAPRSESDPHSPESDAFLLNRSFDHTAPPKTRVYRWTVSLVPVPGAGENRTRIVINGRSPGPIIQANVRDRILVYVTNGLEKEGTHLPVTHPTRQYAALQLHLWGVDGYDVVAPCSTQTVSSAPSFCNAADTSKTENDSNSQDHMSKYNRWDAYRHETELYQPFVEPANYCIGRQAKIQFCREDPTIVLGCHAERKPDVVTIWEAALTLGARTSADNLSDTGPGRALHAIPTRLCLRSHVICGSKLNLEPLGSSSCFDICRSYTLLQHAVCNPAAIRNSRDDERMGFERRPGCKAALSRTPRHHRALLVRSDDSPARTPRSQNN
ncbi:hypothetical protein C8J57DRAFT_1594251 [Mycena rebaudengoi]|nr:hypothetical protein C8J57DRAFT_1594251 [Mycena rebaudengoi]